MIDRDRTDRRALLQGGVAAALSTLFPWDAAAGQAANQVAVARPPSASGPGVPAVTQPLSQYIAASPRAVLPDEIRELGKRHILDTLASMVACRDLQPAVLARRYAAAMSGGGPSTILATSERAASRLP